MEIRLDKYLADMSAGTRSEVKKYRKAGRVQVDQFCEKDDARKIDPGKNRVELDGKQMGVYRATEELYYAVELRCPHLGCALRWNAAEHSWDCPCHGSRFRPDGALIDNPAMRDAHV